MAGRSKCPKCGKKIAWYDNIPVASFFLLMGKCRHCGKKISWQYPAIELITGLLFLSAFIHQFPITNIQYPISNIQYPEILAILKIWFIIAVMVIIFIYDLRWYLIPDIVTLPAIGIIFLMNLFLGYDLWNIIISGIIGGGVFLFQYLVSRGKWVGGGDIRMGALMGVILSWPLILVALFLSYLVGSAVAVFLVLSGRKKWGSQIPFGIFLSSCTLATVFYGEQIMHFYLNLLYRNL